MYILCTVKSPDWTVCPQGPHCTSSSLYNIVCMCFVIDLVLELLVSKCTVTAYEPGKTVLFFVAETFLYIFTCPGLVDPCVLIRGK